MTKGDDQRRGREGGEVDQREGRRPKREEEDLIADRAASKEVPVNCGPAGKEEVADGGGERRAALARLRTAPVGTLRWVHWGSERPMRW